MNKVHAPPPHTLPLSAASFQASAVYVSSFVNLSAPTSALRVMHGKVLPMLIRSLWPLLIILEIQNRKP